MGKIRGKRARYQEELERQERQKEQESIITKVCVQPQTHGQKLYIQEIIKNEIILCQGPAGTGKTVIAIGMALQDLFSKAPKYKRIVLMRPVKEACDEHVGYLPGDLEDKMAPWAAPVIDNLLVFIDQSAVRHLFQEKRIEVIPLAYARGRSLNDAFIILDEAQNCSNKQMLMALTRIGHNSKFIANGDLNQNDVTSQMTGLEDAMQRLEGMPHSANVILDETDIVRNPMIGEIIRRYS